MKISFASERPAGAYALALPVWGDDALADRLGGLSEPGRALAARAAEAQRFERELASVAELFVPEGDGARRLLLVGLGGTRDETGQFERIGATLAGRLLTSGETKLVIDATGLGLDGDVGGQLPLHGCIPLLDVARPEPGIDREHSLTKPGERRQAKRRDGC